MKWLTLTFAAVLVGIIGLANTGALRGQLAFLHELPLGDKIGHFVLIGTMALLLNLCLRAATVRVAGLPVLKGSLIVAAIAAVEELSQIFVRSRSFSWSDLLADLLGIAVIGSLAVLWFRRSDVSRPRDAGTGSPPETARP